MASIAWKKFYNLQITHKAIFHDVTVTTADINGGTIDGAVIGGASAAAGSFTALNTSGAVVFNEAGADVDFRVESDGNANMLFVDGGNNRVGIGTSSPDGTLHVHTATAGAVSADNNADDLVLENSAGAGLTILSPNTQTNSIWFGDEDDSAVAGFVYDHSDNSFKIYAANALFATIDSSGNVGVGVTPTANMVGIAVEAGVITLKETTTPTADANYGKIYTKSDNKLYFQDGAGAEHEIAFV